jgi:hypothetical protein
LSGRFGRTDAALEAFIAVLILVLVALSPSRAKPLHPDLALTVSATADGPPIEPGFIGLSLEYPSVEAYAGSNPAALNPLFLRLVRGLAPGQAPVLRIGGDSADHAWVPTSAVAQPPGVNFVISPAWTAVARALAHQLGARLILGINLEANSSTLAAAEGTSLLGGIGSGYVRALELGNEPDLYGSFAWYRTSTGTKITGRPSTYSFSDFASDFSNLGSALPGRVALAGPSLGTFSWTDQLSSFLSAEPRVALVTLHRYPLQRCFIRRSSPRYPTIANLLSRNASIGLADRFARFVAVARARHLPVRVDEFNTVSCGAVPEVSQTFASALWSVDALFAFARLGVAGVNVHTFPGAGYELFSFRHTVTGWHGSVAPMYYGLRMFARAAPPGSRPVSVSRSTVATVRGWATAGRDGRTRIVLINTSGRRSHVVAVRVPAARGSASVLRLTGPGLRARTGVSLKPGKAISPDHNRYTVMLPAASAAMLTVP